MSESAPPEAHDPRGRMRFRILGPLEVFDGGGTEIVRLGGPRQQAVAAMLLLEANRVIPVDRLISAIWDEEPPTTARGQVQICISTLRRQITSADGGQLIDTRGPGYLLHVAEGTLDAHLFEIRVAAGRTALAAEGPLRAAAEFREALALWSGPAMSGVNSRLVQRSVAQLNEQRMLVLEECLGYELSAGMHHDVIGELLRLAEEHPLRENIRVLLMTALYRAGRQAEALDAYRHARTTLMDELGIEPGPELRRLHHAILNGSPAPGPAGRPSAVPVTAPETASAAAPPRTRAPARPQVPRLLPAAIPDFTGRKKIVAELAREGLDRDASQAVPINVIVGRGGAGKTTLAVHVAHRLAARFSDGQLFARLRNGDTQANPADILERFLRALGANHASLPEGIEERAEMYRDLLGTRKMLIVLDDAMSEQQVAALLPGNPQCSVIVTSRKRLTGLPSANRVEVDGFSHASAVDLLTQVAGAGRIHGEPDSVAALCDLCGYLPLALRIVAARLAARPHWSVGDLVERLVDESRRLDELNHGEMGVRASISLTYDSLSPDARRLFRRLALSEAPNFASWVGSPLLQTDLRHGQDLLEELAEAYLLEIEPGPESGLARYRFHDIMKPFARERLAAEESAQERHKAMESLLGGLLFLAGEAHRREYSGDFLQLRSGASRWRLPDALVDRLLENPLAWFEHERLSIVAAVHQAAAGGLTGHSWDLALNAVTLFEAHTYYGDWRDTHEAALKAACRAGDRRGEAAMRYSLGSLYMFEQQPDQAMRQFARARELYEQLSDRHGAALVLRNLAYLDRMNGNLKEALACWEEALGTFQVVGDRIAEAHVLQNMAQVHLDFGEDEIARGLLDQAGRICAELGNRRVGAQVQYRLGELYSARNDLDRAEEAYRGVLVAVREADDRVGECHALLGLATVSLRRDAVHDAARGLAEAQELAVAIGERMLENRVELALADLALRSGRLDAAAEHAERAALNFQELKAAQFRAQALFLQGQIHHAAGRPTAALTQWQDASIVLAGLDPGRTVALAAEVERHMAALANGLPLDATGPGGLS